MVNIRTLKLLIDTATARTSLDQLKVAQKSYAASTGDANRDNKKLDKSMKGVGNTARELRRALIGVFAGVSAGQAIRSSISLISEYEKQLVILGGVSRASAKDQLLLAAANRELGATTLFTASQAAEAQVLLARSGLDTQAILENTAPILDLAAAANLDLARAAAIATESQKQFGFENDELADALNDLFVISNRTAPTVDQLAAAMTDAGIAGAQFGESVGDVAALVGVLIDRGFKAERAGVAVRQTFLQLANPSSAALKALKSLKIGFDEVNPEVRTAEEIWNRFAKAELSAGVASQIFGDRAALAAVVLAGNTEKLDELRLATRGNADELTNLARAMEQTLSGETRALISAFQELILQMGDNTGGGLTSAVVTLRDALRFFAGVEKDVSEEGKILAGVIGGILTTATIAFTAALLKMTVVALANPFGLLAASMGLLVGATIKYRKSLVEVAGETVQVGDITEAAFEFMGDQGEVFFKTMEVFWSQFAGNAELAWIAISGVSRNTIDNIVLNAISARALIPEILGGLSDNEASGAILDIGRRSFDDAKLREQRFSEITEGQASSRAELGSARDRSGPSLFDRIRSTKQGRESEEAKGAGVAFLVAQRAAKVAALAFAGITPRTDTLAESTANLTLTINDNTTAFDVSDKARKKALKTIDDIINAAEFETKVVGLSNDERQREVDILDLRSAATTAGIEDVESLIEAYDKLTEKTAKLNQIQELSTDIGNAFGDFTNTVLKDFSDIGEAFENMVRQLIDSTIQAAVIKPFIDLITGSASEGTGIAGFIGNITGANTNTESAQGNFFSSGTLSPMASGSFIDRTTFSPKIGGGANVLGEGGGEFVMPAARDSRGRLGIRAMGGSSGPSMTFNITAPDAKTGIGMSERQMRNRFRKALR